MNVWAFALLLAATIVFVIEWLLSGWKNLLALGLGLLSFGLIVQFAAKAHQFHF